MQDCFLAGAIVEEVHSEADVDGHGFEGFGSRMAVQDVVSEVPGVFEGFERGLLWEGEVGEVRFRCGGGMGWGLRLGGAGCCFGVVGEEGVEGFGGCFVFFFGWGGCWGLVWRLRSHWRVGELVCCLVVYLVGLDFSVDRDT